MQRFAFAAVLLAAALLLNACQTTGSTALRPSVRPEELLGRDTAGVEAALGAPKRVRREAEAEIWQYDGGSCVLDVFLYPEGSIRKVLHVEARDTAGKKADAATCVARVQDGGRVS